MTTDHSSAASPIVAGMTVTVMGIGRFGGGAGVVRHLLDQGCRVIATDLLDEASLGDMVAQLRSHPAAERLELRLGRHEIRDFTEADLVVANPAVPRPSESAFLNAARARGVPITTEIRLAVDALPKRRFVGVTGSSGKSSTASMIHHALEHLGVPTALGGNIGGSLLDEAPKIADQAWVVLELSSFMLHWLGEDRRPWSPQLAVLTNLAPNHLDWHGDLPSYVRAKAEIIAHRPDAKLLTAFHREHPTVSQTMAEASGDWWTAPARETERHWHDVDPDAIDLKVLGSHQRRNARLALAAVKAILEIDALDHERATLHRSLGEFAGLPHRLQLLPPMRRMPGVRFIDDSKSTTPDATLLAIEALEDPSRVHLIAGGADKGADLAAIRGQAPSLAGLYAIGAVSTSLVEGGPSGERSRLSGTLRQAIDDAMPKLRDGDTLLLSPGCASWDQFSDYRERGKAFAAEIERRDHDRSTP
jgi:UDP-N-acetylmuramoylalanine--D-glutamate ligase